MKKLISILVLVLSLTFVNAIFAQNAGSTAKEFQSKRICNTHTHNHDNIDKGYENIHDEESDCDCYIWVGGSRINDTWEVTDPNPLERDRTGYWKYIQCDWDKDPNWHYNNKDPHDYRPSDPDDHPHNYNDDNRPDRGDQDYRGFFQNGNDIKFNQHL